MAQVLLLDLAEALSQPIEQWCLHEGHHAVTIALPAQLSDVRRLCEPDVVVVSGSAAHVTAVAEAVQRTTPTASSILVVDPEHLDRVCRRLALGPFWGVGVQAFEVPLGPVAHRRAADLVQTVSRAVATSVARHQSAGRRRAAPEATETTTTRELVGAAARRRAGGAPGAGLEPAGVGVVMADLNGTAVSWNRRAAEMLLLPDLSEQTAGPQPPRPLPDDLAALVGRVAARGSGSVSSMGLPGPGGGVAEVTLSPTHLDGRGRGVVMVLQDITVQIEAVTTHRIVDQRVGVLGALGTKLNRVGDRDAAAQLVAHAAAEAVVDSCAVVLSPAGDRPARVVYGSRHLPGASPAVDVGIHTPLWGGSSPEAEGTLPLPLAALLPSGVAKALSDMSESWDVVVVPGAAGPLGWIWFTARSQLDAARNLDLAGSRDRGSAVSAERCCMDELGRCLGSALDRIERGGDRPSRIPGVGSRSQPQTHTQLPVDFTFGPHDQRIGSDVRLVLRRVGEEDATRPVWGEVLVVAPGRVAFLVGEPFHSAPPPHPATTLAAMLKSHLMEGGSPAQGLAAVSRLARLGPQAEVDALLCRFLCGVLDLDSGELALCSAAHLPPVLASGGRAQYVQMTPSMPAGLDCGFEDTLVTLSPDSRLTAFTEALVVGRNGPEDRMMSHLRRLAARIHAGADRSTDALLAATAPPERTAVVLTLERADPGIPSERSGTAFFPAALNSPSLARRWAAGLLSEWGASGLTDDTLLLLSETTANAVRHAESRIEVILEYAPGRLYCAVSDSSRRLPRVESPGEESESGRGLWLVKHLANEWGVDRLTTGKRVWFRITG